MSRGLLNNSHNEASDDIEQIFFGGNKAAMNILRILLSTQVEATLSVWEMLQCNFGSISVIHCPLKKGKDALRKCAIT